MELKGSYVHFKHPLYTPTERWKSGINSVKTSAQAPCDLHIVKI